MATMVGKQHDLVSALCSMIELDLDAIEAYQAAIDRIKDGNDKTRMAEFMADHERHVTELSPFVTQLGGVAPTKADAKAILTRGKVIIGGLMGDHAILIAMKTNEDDTNTAYERLVARADLTPQLRAILERNLADERRHRQYIEGRLGKPTTATTGSRASVPSIH